MQTNTIRKPHRMSVCGGKSGSGYFLWGTK